MRVVDVGTSVSGSYCARLLADFGADVVKVEDLSDGGDPIRSDGPPITNRDGAAGDSALFVYLNQNKRSVAVDLQSEQGREIWRRLLFGADVVVDSGETGSLSRQDVSFEQIERANPRSVVVRISPFGQGGPYSGRPACHLTVSALGGLVTSLGDPTREPLDVGFPLLEYVSAVVGAVGAVASWRACRDSGRGRLVDVSQQEVAVRMHMYPTVMATLGLSTKRRTYFPMYIMAQNGWVAVNTLSAQHWKDACVFMGLDEVADDQTMSDPAVRNAAAPALQKRMDAWAADQQREDIFEVGQLLRIPVGIPYTLLEVVEQEHYNERGLFRPLETTGGTVKQPAGPFGSSPIRDDWRDAPGVGEHTTEVVEEWLRDGDRTRVEEG
ncbi:MAG: CoA transferase [Jiangellaceae bacterium]